jgi:DNA modification methylase
MSIELILGDCLEVMRKMPDKSIDAVVTDPPYELGFMGKSWDNTGIAYQVGMWAEVLRILKPGGHLLSFGGSRTYHRMACAIEDAGFEIRDQLQWIYGSGFPKSLDVSKAIDKDNGKSSALYKFTKWFSEVSKDKTNKEIDSYLGLDSNGATASHYRCLSGQQPRFPRLKHYYKLQKWIGFDNTWDDVIIEAEREVIGKKSTNKTVYQAIGSQNTSGEVDITSPATPEAQYWQGWGTALKPAHEPIVLARKPITGTVANNVLAYGTGGINIDGCRVGTTGACNHGTKPKDDGYMANHGIYGKFRPLEKQDYNKGRFPANILHDGSDEVVGMFPVTTSGNLNNGHKRGDGTGNSFMGGGGVVTGNYGGDSGSAARFFYSAKASRSERNAGLEGMPDKTFQMNHPQQSGTLEDRYNASNKNYHPTVKPIAVMRWLVRLITPPNGTVLDPFTGSGTTGIAAVLEGFDFIGIEREAEYHEIARRRIEHWQSQFQMRLPLEAE